MQPDRRKHSRIICAFSMGTAEVSVCLFVLSSFSPVMIGWYLQAVSTYKMTQMAVFPYDVTSLQLCRILYTSQHAGVIAESVSSFTGFL